MPQQWTMTVHTGMPGDRDETLVTGDDFTIYCDGKAVLYEGNRIAISEVRRAVETLNKLSVFDNALAPEKTDGLDETSEVKRLREHAASLQQTIDDIAALIGYKPVMDNYEVIVRIKRALAGA